MDSSFVYRLHVLLSLCWPLLTTSLSKNRLEPFQWLSASSCRIRNDGKKICDVFQRACPEMAESLGTWNAIKRLMAGMLSFLHACLFTGPILSFRNRDRCKLRVYIFCQQYSSSKPHFNFSLLGVHAAFVYLEIF